MLSFLQQWDADLLLAINGWHCPFADQLMWLISGKFSSALIILVLLALPIRHRRWKETLTLLIAIAVVVLIADRVSSGIIKPLVERLRPTHDPQLQSLVHVVNHYRGGLYGFVSSHAANLFGIATMVAIVMHNRHTWIAMMAWAALVSYSRIYLGVHYPGDVIGGMMVGLASAWIVAWLWKKAYQTTGIAPRIHIYSEKEIRLFNRMVVLNLVLLLVIAVLKTTFL